MKSEEQAAGLLLLSGDKQGTTSLATRLPERRGEQVEKLGGGHWNRPREQKECEPQAGLGDRDSTKKFSQIYRVLTTPSISSICRYMAWRKSTLGLT